jgi:hypothetical protein
MCNCKEFSEGIFSVTLEQDQGETIDAYKF